MSNLIRLNKFISDSGFSSRREADKLIEQQRVRINDSIPELGTKVTPGDVVTVDGQLIQASATDKADREYIAYHKPVGITCTTELHIKGNIVDAIGHKQRIFPIGRLDKASEGLIFLTSDGDIVNKILRAENAHDKEYVVTVNRPLTEHFIQKMANGIRREAAQEGSREGGEAEAADVHHWLKRAAWWATMVQGLWERRWVR